MASQANYLKHLERAYTHPSQTLPKDWRGRNTPKVILWGHHHPDSKTRQRRYQNRKLQVNNFDEYRCNNFQQNISEPNPTTHKKDHIPQSSSIHSRVTTMVQHTSHQQKKLKNHMIISIDAEKAFDKIQHPFMIKKTLTKSGYRGNISQHNKSYLWQTHSQHNTQWWKAESLLAKIRNKTGCPHSPLFFFFLKIDWLIDCYVGSSFLSRAFSSCGKRGPLFITVRGPLTVVASLVAEHKLQTRRLSSCGSRA